MVFVRVFSLMKKITLFVLAVAIAIPLYYGSTNPQYLVLRILHASISLKHSLIPDSTRPTMSADARAFETLLSLQTMAHGDLTADVAATVKQLRSSFAFATMMPRPSACQVTKKVYNYNEHAVDAFWVNYHHGKELANTDQIVLYLHGGGYTLGDIIHYSGFECHLSRLFNRSVIHVEYGLLPEHSMLDITEDIMTLYSALLADGISPSGIIIMGDSAGGALSLITVQTLLSRGLPIPGAVISISPFADATLKHDSFNRNRFTDALVSESISKFMVHLMCNSHVQLDRDDPRISPLLGTFEGFPPLYIVMGTSEILEDISRDIAKKAQAAGVDVTLEVGQYMQHIYPLFFHYFPEARLSLDRMRQWIETKLNDDTTKH